MTAPLSVRKVESEGDLHTFLMFPWALYKDDPYWVPPLVSMQRHKLDQRKNPAWSYMEGDYFIAWRGSRPAGTIAAFVNRRHNEYWQDRTGFFGMFEVYDDQAAANALLDTAAECVRGLGCDVLRGPASFSTNDLCGVLVEQVDRIPAIMTPYNPPYYCRLLENAPGFVKAMDLYNYHFTLPEFHTSKTLEQAMRITRKNNARRGITVRTLDPRRVRQELGTLKEIYNTAWERNWGFVPMSEAELDDLVNELGRFLEPRLTLFAAVNGEPAAFLLAFPDLNQVLYRAYPRPGKPELISFAQALWYWKIRPSITQIRIALLGVNQRYRNIGVEAALFAELFDVFRELAQEGTRWQEADAGWVLETNTPMNRLVEALGGVRYRTFRFYERAFAR